MKSLAGKSAVVTGAGSGIGAALAEALTNEGMRVVLADIEQKALETVVDDLRVRGAQVTGVATDVMSEPSVRNLAVAAKEAFGPIHLLCNNAGVASSSGQFGMPIWEQPIQDWTWVMGVNFYGVLHGLRAFVPDMIAHGEAAHIVNTGSLAGLLAGGGIYGASKHTVLSLTETLHTDLCAIDSNVKASLLCPSLVRTDFFTAERNRPQGLQVSLEIPEEIEGSMALVEELLSHAAPPKEVASAVVKGILREDFYILPNPAWDRFVEDRVCQIVARKAPATTWDMHELAERYARGEKL
ncbi:MAG: SDR family NAD(P)-dependent oxidoreductase [Pseudomonadota bacterium]